MKRHLAFVTALASFSACTLAGQEELQLTHAPQNHVLTNINVWSPQGDWIVYDVRSGNEFNGDRIERVNTKTFTTQTLYTSKNGANCGVVTHSPTEPKVVFIHGPENPSSEWTYAFTRRRGVIVETQNPGTGISLDAMNYAPPFTPGALRGGSHVHVFSPDGQWVSFTYEDEVLARLDASLSAPAHDRNLRTIAVSAPFGPVEVASSHPRNNDGTYFSMVVAHVTDSPKPGSDEIVKAFEEGWVGNDGYIKSDGSHQKRALTFQGHVIAADGSKHAEVFIVDLPEEIGDCPAGTIEGTITTRPTPPPGTEQRRLTYTSDRKYPGVSQAPRHWLRVNSAGTQIAFLMADDKGIIQLWNISPNGGEPHQLTRNSHDIASAFTWSPDGKAITHIMDGSVCITDTTSGATQRLTPKQNEPFAPSTNACVFSPDGKAIAYTRSTSETPDLDQVFIVSSGATNP